MPGILDNITNKRKSNADDDYAPLPPKKTRKTLSTASKPPANDHGVAVALVDNIMTYPQHFILPQGDEEVRAALLSLARYAMSLQAISGNAAAPKTPAQLAEAVAKLKGAAISGITKHMSWRPSCKTGTAKWSYDGVCADPDVFSTMMGSNGRTTWKMKRYKVEQFEAIMGHEIVGSVRYDTLHITSDVTVRWDETEGTFRLSGSYGVRRTS